MKKTKRILVALLICIMAMALPVSVSAAKLNKSKATISVGEKVQLQVKGTSKKVTWKTSNKKIATVSKKGLVTGKKKGTAKITAQIGKKKYTCTVKVLQKNKNYEFSNTNVNWATVPQCNREFMCFIFAHVTKAKYNADGSLTAELYVRNNTLGKTYYLSQMYLKLGDWYGNIIAEDTFIWNNVPVYPMSITRVTVTYPKESVRRKLPISKGITYWVGTN